MRQPEFGGWSSRRPRQRRRPFGGGLGGGLGGHGGGPGGGDRPGSANAPPRWVEPRAVRILRHLDGSALNPASHPSEVAAKAQFEGKVQGVVVHPKKDVSSSSQIRKRTVTEGSSTVL